VPLLHLPPQPSSAPQAFPAQLGLQHAPAAVHTWPVGHPHFPPQPFKSPQSLPAQTGVQQPASAPPGMQISPVGQVRQVPPQPFGSPQTFPVQAGAQQPPSLSQTPPGQPHFWPQPLSAVQALVEQSGLQQAQPPASGRQVPVPATQSLQRPPQPFDSPQCLPTQIGVQTQVPSWQLPASQPGLQQVSMQAPLEQAWPASQWTLAQAFCTQVPPTQISPVLQILPSHGFGALHDRLQVKPAGQGASQGRMPTQAPTGVQ
jgi:hypothetical protein